ncbi:ArnT family glycosyltransferase, partial [Patescibacteria group bacterium]
KVIQIRKYLNDITYFLIFLTVLLIIKFPILNIPLYVDEMTHVVGVFRIINNNFNPFVEWWSYHQPFVYEMLAVIYKIFGFSILITHLFNILWGSIGIFFTYKLGKMLFDNKVGIFSALTFLFMPLFFTEVGMFRLATPLIGLATAMFYFYFKGKRYVYIFIAILIGLTKEPAIVLILLFALFEFYKNYQKNKKVINNKLVKNVIFYLIPLIPFLIWLILNKVFLGWFMWPTNMGFFSLQKPWVPATLDKILKNAILEDFRWIFFLVIAIGLLKTNFTKKVKHKLVSKEILFLTLTYFVMLVLFIIGPYYPRYLLFVLPGIIIAFSAAVFSVFKLLKKEYLIIPFYVIIWSLFVLSWFSISEKPLKWHGETNLGYLSIIDVHKQAVNFTENNFDDYLIITHQPIDQIFRNPSHGYTKKGQNATGIDLFFKEVEKFKSYKKRLVVIPYFFSWESKSMGAEHIRLLTTYVKNNNYKLIKIIENEGDRVEIYENTQ